MCHVEFRLLRMSNADFAIEHSNRDFSPVRLSESGDRWTAKAALL
jgi:hypothetical protein